MVHRGIGGIRMKFLKIAVASVALTSCASVEVQYAEPGNFNDIGHASANANNGLSYYALQKIHVVVEPVAEEVVAPEAQSGKRPALSKTKADNQSDSTDTKKDSAAPDKAKEKPTAASDDDLVAPLAVINGKKWKAQLSVVADDGHGFMMGGTNGFWNKTTVSGTRRANSSLVESVSIKAENLVATRIGQIATVLGYAGPKVIKNEAGDRALIPFEFDVELSTLNKPQAIDAGRWWWKFETNATPAGAVEFATFLKTAKNAGKVAYFPVPACLTGELQILDGTASSNTVVARFPLVVSTAEIVRLEPLPLDGKLTLSKICSASVEGDILSNRADEVFQNLAALQAAYAKLNGASSTEETSDTAPSDEPSGDGAKPG